MTPSRLLLVCLLCASSARAAVNDPGFTQSTFASGLEQVTGLRWAPDGTHRLFALQKTGRVRIVRDGVLLAQPFAAETVYTGSECGLIGIAFDPAFVVNRYVYLFVTVSDHEQQIIRYTDVDSVGQERRVIVAGLPTAGVNHDGGGIGFGPDGMLYWSIGDLGSRQVGVNEDLTSLASKVSRADRFGLPVNDNPFFDGPGPNADFIWARGFRNPFRLTFQPGSGRLWVSVAGSRYEQIFAVGRGDHGGWVTYENNQPQGFLPPAIAYRTNAAETKTLEGAARSGGVTTFTTVEAHPFRPGARVFIRGVLDAAFNGDFYVAQVLDDRRFTVVQPGADATSTAGSAATQALGGSVTGGAFYDATAFPAAYQGNFFFGDFNSGNLMRATFAPSGQVATVDLWGTGFGQATDAAVGPDGALYVATFSGTVHRLAYAPQGQAFIISRTHVDVREGAQASFAVSLAQRPPGGGLTATLALSGDPDLTLSSGASLTFTPQNHSVPKIVTVSAARDADSTDDTATLTVSAAGVTSQAVEVVGRDEQPAFELSSNILTVAEGGTVTFTVALASAPSGPVTVSVGSQTGDADTVVSGGATLSFTPADYRTPQPVTLASAEDADQDSELATFQVTAPGYQSRTVSVRVTDNETRPVAFTSTPVTTAVIRAPYRYTARASGNPAPTFALTHAPAGMTMDAATGVISWVPGALGTHPVEVAASSTEYPTPVKQAFTVTVLEDQPPTCVLTQPKEGATVSGTVNELYGDGQDDVDTVKAEFFSDGQLLGTDENTDGHYHLGGSHGRWDTTALPDGEHTVQMVVHDTAGQTCAVQVTITVANGSPDGGTGGGSSGRCGCGAAGPGAGFVLFGWTLAVLARRRSGRERRADGA